MFASWLAIAVIPCVAAMPMLYWLAWGGSLVLSVTLVILMWTRWGQSRPLQKCAALSLLVHLMLAFLTMTVRIVAGDGGGGGGGGPPIRVRIVEEGSASAKLTKVSTDMAAEIAAPELLDAPPEPVEAPTDALATDDGSDEASGSKDDAAPELATTEPTAEESSASRPLVAEQIKGDTDGATNDKHAAAETVEKKAEPTANPEPATPAPAEIAVNQTPAIASKPASQTATDTYSLRNASDRLSVIAGQGGDAKTEGAVVAALNWLAAAQSSDGRWSANQFGAGQEQMVLGQDRGGAGRNADTGISALALLAFMGAGHSHLQGEYRDSVRRGLDFLLRSQAPDGNLFGDSSLYAQMYCHSMATFALAEAQAMSGDRRLEPAVLKAVNFSLRAQNTGTGGWRYRPGDTGDTSQMGWQVMALASAKKAGLNVPDQTWNRVDRFLRSVRRGTFGGLASYRPDSPATTSMTAEALYCHQILHEMSGLKLTEQAAHEATNQIITALPGAERVNLYYWYYATLALHGRQQSSTEASAAWRTWNDAMTVALLSTQVSTGDNAGSWDTNSLWGGYGGRVYTTAMAAMCLEVYYRYAPASDAQSPSMADRSGWQPISK